METTRDEIGMLDFEVELAVRDYDTREDPYLGLTWEIARFGIPGYQEALRDEALKNPAFRKALDLRRAQESLPAAEQILKAVGVKFPENGEAPAPGVVEVKRDPRQEVAELLSSGDDALEQNALFSDEGAEQIARHLVRDVTRDGKPVCDIWRKCPAEHVWSKPLDKCPECGERYAGEEKRPIKDTHGLVMALLTRKNRVKERVAGVTAQGPALRLWILEQAKEIEDGSDKASERLEKNLLAGSGSTSEPGQPSKSAGSGTSRRRGPCMRSRRATDTR